MILLMTVYTFRSFTYFSLKTEVKKNRSSLKQSIGMFLFHFIAYLICYLMTKEKALLLFYGCQVIFFIIVLSFNRYAYPKASRMLTSHMCIMLSLGFIMLTRLSYNLALKQFAIAIIGSILSWVIPFVMLKMKFLRKMVWLYGILGILMLLMVMLFGDTSYGAKLSITIMGFSFQPSEFVKIIYVFFLAAIFEHRTDFKQVLKASIMAAIHVLVLVFSKDLGGALIFFVVYVIMLYLAAKKPFYLLGGLIGGSGCAMVAYKLFGHVQTRVTAWMNPWTVIDTKGYQIAQSLFAIGTGSWFGLGLYKGMPYKIPVVEQDFIFSAIAEEMGGLIAVCVILICLNCVLLFFNAGMQSKNSFYSLMAMGLGVTYGFQIFLTIGGAIKLIPSTGVTLPFISYGGSSLFSTLFMFAIIQGLYIIKQEEGETHESEEK